jgi:hypothetical protein
MLSFQISALRWGRVAQDGTYGIPEKSSIDKAVSSAGSCSDLQNDAGTEPKNWHKSDTGSSCNVHGAEFKIRRARATTLALAIGDTHPEDARQLLTAALLDLSVGQPEATRFFDTIREDAAWWASLATPAELLEFMGAALDRLRDTALHREMRKRLFTKIWRSFDADDQARFLAFARGEA